MDKHGPGASEVCGSGPIAGCHYVVPALTHSLSRLALPLLFSIYLAHSLSLRLAVDPRSHSWIGSSASVLALFMAQTENTVVLGGVGGVWMVVLGACALCGMDL